MQIVRKKLSADEITPPGTRYDPECDCVQQSPDGGTTWNDAPGLDPRSSSSFRLPPTTVDDPQCNAAANMVAKLRFFVDTDLASASIAGVASSLFAAISLFLPGVGIIVEAILIAVDVILGIGAGEIAAAFTETVYDDFLCVFYCNIDADGQMSDAQLADIYTAVAATFDATVQAVFGAHSSTMGPVGWSNAGVRGESTDADCSACVCGPWCYEWTGAEITAGDWSGFTQGALSNFGATGFTLSSGAIEHIEFTFTWGGDGGGGDSAAAIWVPTSTRVVLVAPISVGGSPQTITWDGEVISPDSMQLGANGAAGSTTTITITNIKVMGTGTLPAWTHGHTC